jgi:hypothetical protein
MQNWTATITSVLGLIERLICFERLDCKIGERAVGRYIQHNKPLNLVGSMALLCLGRGSLYLCWRHSVCKPQ